MASIPMHNETAYILTDAITQQITRDAQEHFGEEIRAIRVQSGLERHAFNARTHEVRYAFSPQDFGVGFPVPLAPAPHTVEQPRARRRASPSAAEPDTDRLAAPFEDVEVDAENLEPLETSLDSLEEGLDDEEDDVFSLDDPHDDQEDEESGEDDEEDDGFFDPDAHEP